MVDFPTSPLFDAPLGGTPRNFWMKLTTQKLELWMGLPYGENFMILSFTVFV